MLLSGYRMDVSIGTWFVGMLVLVLAWPMGLMAQSREVSRPNLLWITAEDMSATLGCYGDRYATTPHLDRLATESCRYTHAFATAPVCSPSRSCLINGVVATQQGTHPMRSLFPVPASMRGFPAVLRRAGFYTSNNVKTDYNTSSEPEIIAASWDASGPDASWRGRRSGQPFFSVHNLMTSHQSRTMVWPDEQFRQEVQRHLPAELIHDPATVPLPPYYPDTNLVRSTLARYYDCVTAMDREVGQLLAKLEADGLAEDTIVFFYSDHGSGMPRHKRALFDSGTHVPLLIRFPQKYRHLAPCDSGEATDRLVSFEDFGPTVLSLAGIDSLPDVMRGRPFLGALATAPRSFVFSHRDRVDEIIDMARSVRSSKYLYIRNFMPHLGYHQPSAWVDQGQVMDDFYALAASGQANAAQAQFLNPTRTREALFDCETDPLNLNNLADQPEYESVLVTMRGVLRDELIASRDLGLVPEIELLRQTEDATPLEAAATGRFDFAKLLAAAELVGTDRFAAIDRALEDPDPSVRYWGAVACSALSELPGMTAERLETLCRDDSDAVRIEAATALTRHGGKQLGFATLLKLIQSSEETTVLHAARALELLANPAVRGEIETLARKYADAPGDVAWCIRFTTSAYLKRVR